jgi:hypothetical protein
MDMTIYIEEDTIVTTLFEKPSNFHLYIPPSSFHPPGLLRGIIYGMMNRIHTLCSAHDDRKLQEITFFRHLQRRGYQPKDLYTLFNKAIIRARAYVTNPTAAPANQTGLRTIQFLHLEYHTRNPAARDLQSIWQNSVAAPLGKVPLAEIENLGEFPCGSTSMIVAHHRTSNLSDLLSCRKIQPNSGPPVLEYAS